MHNLKHLAIIMDGNRRWARQNDISIKKGHESGANALMNICKALKQYTIPFVTVYAFSTENNNRSKEETEYLFSMLERYLKTEVKKLQDEEINVICIGNFSIFPKNIQNKIQEINKQVPSRFVFTLYIALNYGGKQEIIDSIKKIQTTEITINSINENLYIPNMPDVDLLIRTGGKQRLSNFLIWQTTYAELYFTPTLWPEFTPQHLQEAIDFYHKQERNFGL